MPSTEPHLEYLRRDGLFRWMPGEPVRFESGSKTVARLAGGQEVLDFTSAFGTLSLGRGDSQLLDSILRRASKIGNLAAGLQVSEVHSETLRLIAAVYPIDGESVSFLVPSGSDAIDIALRVAWSSTNRPGVLAFRDSYHGQTGGALRVTGMSCFTGEVRSLTDPLDKVGFTPYPDYVHLVDDLDCAGVDNTCLLHAESLLRQRPDIGAIVFEPIQNPAGYRVPSDAFLLGLAKLAKKYEVILIADEIFTGSGRCGAWTRCAQLNIQPDIICVGKAVGAGFPCGICITSARLADALPKRSKFCSYTGTYFSNPITLAAVASTIERFLSAPIFEEIAISMDKLRNSLSRSAAEVSFISDVRGIGSIAAIEFGTRGHSSKRYPKLAAEFISHLARKGVLAMHTGLPHFNVVGFCPPYTATAEEVDRVLEASLSCIKSLKSDER